jgi:hypothetical protein
MTVVTMVVTGSSGASGASGGDWCGDSCDSGAGGDSGVVTVVPGSESDSA